MLPKKLIVAFVLSFIAVANLWAGDVESRLIPKVKKIIIEQAKSEDSYQQAYEKIKKLAHDAIEYDGVKSTAQLDEMFFQIEKELSYDYPKLNKDQMISLILKAINS